jgi:hypothetical protein
MAKKVILGLGSSLAKTPKGRIVKIKTTFKGVAGRAIFFVVTKTSAIFPVIVRLKKDPLGENLSFKNKTFQEVFDQNYQLIEDDLVNDRFEIYEI